MKCKHCDSAVGDAARFCEACGSSLRGDDLGQALAGGYRLELAGELERAVRVYEELLDRANGAESVLVRKHLGNLHFRLGHLRRAREHLTHASRMEPEHAALWHDLGVVDYHLADLDGAIEALRRALGLDPTLQLTNFWLGNALYHRGDLDAAAEAFSNLIAHYPNFTIARFHRGVIYRRQGRKAEAARDFRSVLLNNPEDQAARAYVTG